MSPKLHNWNDYNLLDKLEGDILTCSSAKRSMRALLEKEWGFTIRQTSKKSDHVSIFWRNCGVRLGGFAPMKHNERGFRENVAKQLVENIKLAAAKKII